MATVTDYDYLYKSNLLLYSDNLNILVLLIGDVRVGKTSFLTKSVSLYKLLTNQLDTSKTQ